MASIMGRDAPWWSVPAAVAIGVPMYTNAAGIIPIVEALMGKGAALGTVLAFMMSVIALSAPEVILALIGNQQDVLFGTLLMFLYSIGHGALLLVAGSSVGFAQRVASSRWAGRANWLFTCLAGALLVGYALYLAAEMAGWLR